MSFYPALNGDVSVAEDVRFATGRDASFLHGFEHGRLRFRRGPIDFIRQHDVGKDRARQKAELFFACRLIRHDDFRAGDIARHQIGRELDPRKPGRDTFAKQFCSERLRDPRNPPRL